MNFLRPAGQFWKVGAHCSEQPCELADDTVDAIFAFDLIKHLLQPRDFIDRCFAKLRAGGSLLILTGGIGSISARLARTRWWYLQYPEHISFPSLDFFVSLTDLNDIGAQLLRLQGILCKRYKSDRWICLLQRLGQIFGIASLGADHVAVELTRK